MEAGDRPLVRGFALVRPLRERELAVLGDERMPGQRGRLHRVPSCHLRYRDAACEAVSLSSRSPWRASSRAGLRAAHAAPDARRDLRAARRVHAARPRGRERRRRTAADRPLLPRAGDGEGIGAGTREADSRGTEARAAGERRRGQRRPLHGDRPPAGPLPPGRLHADAADRLSLEPRDRRVRDALRRPRSVHRRLARPRPTARAERAERPGRAERDSALHPGLGTEHAARE